MDLVAFKEHIEAGRLPKRYDGDLATLEEPQRLLLTQLVTPAPLAEPLSLYKMSALAVPVPVKQEGVSDEVLEYDWIISTAAVDRDRDTIAVDGWLLEHYELNPVVLWAHRYGELPIGRTVQLMRYPDRLGARQRFPDPGVYPFADLVRGLVRDAFLRSSSVGFRPFTWNYNEERRGIDFLTQELLEWSICPVPSNPQALIQARAMGHNVDLLQEWAIQVLDQVEQEPGMWLPRAKAEQVLRLLESSTSVPVTVNLSATSPPVPLDAETLVAALTPKLAGLLQQTGPTPPRLDLTSGLGTPGTWNSGTLQHGKLAALLAVLKQPEVDLAQVSMMMQECMGCLMDAASGVIHATDYLRDMLAMMVGNSATPPEGEETQPLEVIDLALAAHKGVSPSDASKETALMDTPWSAPNLSDFANNPWSELPEDEKRHICQHYAWAQAMPPETFSGLKLPHHRPSDGYIVWRCVTNAAARLPQVQIPNSDMASVRAHLGRHIRAFGRTPPWDGNASAWTEYEAVCRSLEHNLTDRQLQRRFGELLDLLFPDDPNVPDALPASTQSEGEPTDNDLLLLDLDDVACSHPADETEPVVMLTDDPGHDALDLDGLSREDLRVILRDAVQAGVQSALTPYTGRLPDA